MTSRFAKPGDMLTQGQIEAEIQRLIDDQEAGAIDLRDALREAAQTKANWKRDYHQALVSIWANGVEDPATGEARKPPADVRTALAHSRNEASYETHLIAEAVAMSAKDAQATLRSALDAMRTLAANVRAQT